MNDTIIYTSEVMEYTWNWIKIGLWNNYSDVPCENCTCGKKV